MTQSIFYGGEWHRPLSEVQREVHSPVNLEHLGTIADCQAEDIDRAVAAARAAQYAWWKTPESEKALLMHEAAARIRSREKDLATLLAHETGKPLIEAKDCIEWVTACFDYYAQVVRSQRGMTFPPVAPNQLNFTVREPYGVVACIAPFNFPLLLMTWKIAPAMAVGNTVVVKPPHQNPLSTLMMAECLDHLPPGVFNLITGAGETGDLLVRHPGIDQIAFTGSTTVGRKIAAIAGEHLKKVNLELGGIDPLIVFKDADLDVAVPGAAWARLLNAGQVCTSSKRMYVEDAIYDEFVARLVAFVSEVKVGDPMDANTDVGPLISADALAKVETQVQQVMAEGAVLKHGGQRLQPNGLKGHFFAPTVLTEVKHGGYATTEEIFGPVISVIRAKDADDAIRMANDSAYGLGAVIFTNNLQVAMKAMENIKAGSFWINDPLTDNEAAPFGGMRHSGIGRELGVEGLEAFREPKHVHIDFSGERKGYWFPNAARPAEFHE